MRRWALASLAVLASAWPLKAVEAVQSPEPPLALPAAAEALGRYRAITVAEGIDTLERIELGGIPQWISIRGRDRRNPVLLFLHGGPGFPMMPASHAFQGPWEEYFTVVQWDQRGAGKTFSESDTALVGPTLTVPRMIADAEELVSLLRARFEKRKIVLMGHSWGSVLGVELARRHPDWFSVYVGAGQGVDVAAGERLAYRALLATASDSGDTRALAELRALAPYPEADGSIPVHKLYAQRKWMRFYGGYTYGKANDHYFDLVRLSPDYTAADVEAFGPAIAFSFERLWPQLAGWNIRDVTRLDVPVVLFAGVHDLTTPPQLAERWLDRLSAPKKQLVMFSRSGHMMMMEEPGKTFLHLVRDVLPLATSR